MENYQYILNEENLNFVAEISKFAKSEIQPLAKKLDQTNEFNKDIFKKMGELGLFGGYFPEKYNGTNLDYPTYVFLVTEVSRYSPSVAVTFTVQVSLSSDPIYKFGTEEQKEKYLKKMLTGELVGCFCLTEPGAGSDAANLRCTAIKDGNHYIINGTKMFITNGAAADVCVLFARTTKEIDLKAKHKGISAFIVETKTSGFKANKITDELGMRGSGLAELVLEDVKVPAENLLGKEGEGFKIAMATLDGGRAGIAAQANGIAIGAYEQVLKYVKVREQFDKPIASFQNTQFKLAMMRTKIDASLLLTHHAAVIRNIAGAEKMYRRKVSEAKLFAAKVCKEVALEALQLHGGYGYIGEYPAERFLRDSILIDIYEGTGEIQQTVISRFLLG